jgi:hypothetical protein
MALLDSGDNLLRFPLDLSSQSQGHFMKINIFPNQYGTYKNQSATVCLFAPGGGINGPMQWDMDHDYDDVKLARLGTGVLGAVSKPAEAVAGAAAGAARLAGAGVINPKVDVLYSNTQLRRYTFSHFFTPSSARESTELKKIIKLLRKFSSPEIAGNRSGQSFGAGYLSTGGWLIPPAEFEIDFYYMDEGTAIRNPYIPKIARCVLTKIDVNYSQQGEFSTFKDGAPISAQLSMTFREMRIISQRDVDIGY